MCEEKMNEKFDKEQCIGFKAMELKRKMISAMIRLEEKSGANHMVASHGWFINYLYNNQRHPIYQKTLEKEFKMARSSVTSIMQAMEKEGYIRRISVAGDARLKEIVLTEEGKHFSEKSRQNMITLEEKVRTGLNKDEIEFHKIEF